MTRAKKFDCEVWDMRRFRRCDTGSFHTLRRVVSKLMDVAESQAEVMLRVTDTQNRSVKRLSYQPDTGWVIVKHEAHPDVSRAEQKHASGAE